MREPRRLFGELGPRGFLTFQFIVGGNALVALAHPFFIATMIYALNALISQGCNLETILQTGPYVATAGIGYCTSAYLGWTWPVLPWHSKKDLDFDVHARALAIALARSLVCRR